MSKKTDHQLGDAPIQPEYHDMMNGVAEALDLEFGEKEGRCNFISNGADRKDIVTLFKEMIARFEGQPEMQGRA